MYTSLPQSLIGFRAGDKVGSGEGWAGAVSGHRGCPKNSDSVCISVPRLVTEPRVDSSVPRDPIPGSQAAGDATFSKAKASKALGECPEGGKPKLCLAGGRATSPASSSLPVPNQPAPPQGRVALSSPALPRLRLRDTELVPGLFSPVPARARLIPDRVR